MIDQYYEKINKNDLFQISEDLLASLYIYKMLPNLYDATNKIGKIVLANNKCGIRYASVFEPIELSGTPKIVTLDSVENGNYVLMQEGFKNIKLDSVEKKTCGKLMSLETMIDTFVKKAQLEF